MFGYLKADVSKLNEENLDLYRTAYCSLCFALKKHYGVFSRYLLNYDVTFLALLELNFEKDNDKCAEKYCPYKAKKCNCIENREEVFFYCASVLIVLAYEKIIDNIRDENVFKKVIYLFLKLIFRRKYLKACTNYPSLCDEIRENMKLQEEYEAENASVDKAAHPTADSLGKIFTFRHHQDALYHFGYMLGRWVYLADAADDREKDMASGSFNPFLNRYDDAEIESVLNFSIGEAADAFGELPQGKYSALIENIIMEGTHTAQCRVLKGDTK